MQENDLYTKIAQLPRSASLRKVNVRASVVKEVSTSVPSCVLAFSGLSPSLPRELVLSAPTQDLIKRARLAKVHALLLDADSARLSRPVRCGFAPLFISGLFLQEDADIFWTCKRAGKDDTRVAKHLSGGHVGNFAVVVGRSLYSRLFLVWVLWDTAFSSAVVQPNPRWKMLEEQHRGSIKEKTHTVPVSSCPVLGVPRAMPELQIASHQVDWTRRLVFRTPQGRGGEGGREGRVKTVKSPGCFLSP